MIAWTIFKVIHLKFKSKLSLKHTLQVRFNYRVIHEILKGYAFIMMNEDFKALYL